VVGTFFPVFKIGTLPFTIFVSGRDRFRNFLVDQRLKMLDMNQEGRAAVLADMIEVIAVKRRLLRFEHHANDLNLGTFFYVPKRKPLTALGAAFQLDILQPRPPSAIPCPLSAKDTTFCNCCLINRIDLVRRLETTAQNLDIP